jgi:transposase
MSLTGIGLAIAAVMTRELYYRKSGRMRRIMIVAVARKLAIALWRFLEKGLVPQGAMLTNR